MFFRRCWLSSAPNLPFGCHRIHAKALGLHQSEFGRHVEAVGGKEEDGEKKVQDGLVHFGCERLRKKCAPEGKCRSMLGRCCFDPSSIGRRL